MLLSYVFDQDRYRECRCHHKAGVNRAVVDIWRNGDTQIIYVEPWHYHSCPYIYELWRRCSIGLRKANDQYSQNIKSKPCILLITWKNLRNNVSHLDVVKPILNKFVFGCLNKKVSLGCLKQNAVFVYI